MQNRKAVAKNTFRVEKADRSADSHYTKGKTYKAIMRSTPSVVIIDDSGSMTEFSILDAKAAFDLI